MGNTFISGNIDGDNRDSTLNASNISNNPMSDENNNKKHHLRLKTVAKMAVMLNKKGKRMSARNVEKGFQEIAGQEIHRANILDRIGTLTQTIKSELQLMENDVNPIKYVLDLE
jgi:hypothetical protein